VTLLAVGAGVASKVAAVAMVRVVVLAIPEAARHLAPVLAVAGGGILLVAGVLAVRSTGPGRLAVLADLGFVGLVLLAVGLLPGAAGAPLLAGILVLPVVHGLLVGSLLLLDAAPAAPGRRGLVAVVAIALAVLPVHVVLGGRPAAILAVVGGQPSAAAALVVGLGLLAIGLVRAGLRVEPSAADPDVLPVLLVGAMAAAAILLGLFPYPLVDFVSSTTDRLLAVLGSTA
jgi:hypothetical protein